MIRPHDGVFGSDDRKAYYPSGYPWQCIGRVFTWRDTTPPNSWSFYGSGVLVGPRHVLTAAHIAPWGSPNWGMLFVPGYYDGASVVGSGANSWVSDFRSLAPGVDAFGPHDMSLLRLYDPLGDELGYFGAQLYDRSWQDGNYWTLVGYPSAVTCERPSFQTGIPVIATDVDGDAMALEHQGDSTYGDSGGPFFGVWPDGFPYVIGTDSGGVPHEFGGNNICAGVFQFASKRARCRSGPGVTPNSSLNRTEDLPSERLRLRGPFPGLRNGARPRRAFMFPRAGCPSLTFMTDIR